MRISKKYFVGIVVLFVFLSAHVAESFPPMPPFKIGGTVTVDGSQLTQGSDSGYTFIITTQDGSDFIPSAQDTDGLNSIDWYVIDIPIYDEDDQPGGANPGDTAVIHVYRDGQELSVTSPDNGNITVGDSGETEQIDLIIGSPSSPTQYQLTASVQGGGGTVSPTSGTYNEDTVVTLTASPSQGYRVASWSGTDNDSSTSNTNSVTMTSNKSVTVQFEQIPPTQYQLTASVQGGGGTVSPTSGTYNEDTVVTLTASPSQGYYVASWSGTDNDSSISNTNYVTMTSNKSVTVTFSELLPEIESFTAIPNSISQGESSTLSWNLSGADLASINNSIGSIEIPTGSISVSPATTTIYTLTVSNSGGSVSASVSVTVEAGLPPVSDNDNDGIPDSEDTDDDNDALPDVWEQTYGIDPKDSTGVNGKNGDFDDDGWSNYEEYLNGTNPSDNTSFPTLAAVEIMETIPHNGAGVNDNGRVSNGASFCVRIEAFNGIDITDPTSVLFTIKDGLNPKYTRNLGEAEVMRVINLTGEPDTNVSKLWVVYDRSKENTLGNYAYDASVTIKVNAMDRLGLLMDQAICSFKIETETEHQTAHELANLLDIRSVEPDDPGLGEQYDAGIQVDTGDLRGAKIIYDGSEPQTPTFGPSDELPILDVNSAKGVGVAMNLQPPTVFSVPVKLFIPCPGYSDVSNFAVMLYNGEQWVIACDMNGEVLPEGEGWMVPGSRVNHNDGDPSTIEIKVYHFTGVQAGGLPLYSSFGGGCFIDTAASSINMSPDINNSGEEALILLFLMFAALSVVGYIVMTRTRN